MFKSYMRDLFFRREIYNRLKYKIELTRYYETTRAKRP